MPSDPRLPGGGGYTVGPLYNINPNVFGTGDQPDQADEGSRLTTRACSTASTSTFNVRAAQGVTFSGGTSTGKVENDWCDIRAAVPEDVYG